MIYLQSEVTHVTVFIKPNSIGPYLGLSNEILGILLTQGAKKLPEAKVGGLKKLPYLF